MRHMPVNRIFGLLFCAGLFLAAAPVPQTVPADPNAPINESAYPPATKIKIACVGDSITYGYGNTPNGPTNAPPAQLQRMLNTIAPARYDVQNFGVNSLTLLTKGDKPYIKNAAFGKAKDFLPDVVIIMLGTNDTKEINWAHKDDFNADYKEMITQFTQLASHPRVFLCNPPIIVASGSWGINEPDIRLEIPLIAEVAKETSSGVIDVHAAMLNHDADFNSDHVHPNNAGATLIAAAWFKTLTGKDYTGPSTIVAAAPRPASRPSTASAPAAAATKP